MSNIPKIDVSITVKGASIQTDFQRELLVGDESVNVHLDELSSRMLYYSVLAAELAKELKEKKDAFDYWMSTKKMECSTGKSSETAKEDAVVVKYGVEYLKYQKEISDLEYQVAIMNSVVKAWDAKQYMLNALCTNYRTEMEKGIRIKDWNKKVEKGEVLQV